MKVNTFGLKTEVVPEMKEAMSALWSGQIYLEGIDIPKDFSGYGRLKNIPHELSDINNRIENITIWIEEKIISFDKAENSNRNIVDMLKAWVNAGLPKDEFLGYFKEVYNDNFDNSDKFFQYYNKNNNYGVDQGVLRDYYYYDENGNLIKKEEYIRIEKLVMEKYNMSAKDAAILITCLDSIGACSYAAVANDILAEFKYSPKEFEEIFGFPMFRETETGEIVLNGEELLIDLYVYANSQSDSAQQILGFWHLDSTFDIFEGSTIVDKDMVAYNEYGIPYFKGQQYLKDENARLRLSGIEKSYLKSKTISYDYNAIYLVELHETYSGVDTWEMQNIEKEVGSYIEAGYQISLDLQATEEKPIYFETYLDEEYYLDDPTSYTYELTGAHAVKVTDITEEGFIISTWGKKALVTFSELQTKGAFQIICSNISKPDTKEVSSHGN